MITSGYKLKWTKGGQQYSYVLTYDDILDLTRSVLLEGPSQAAVAWALIKRFAFYYPAGKYKTLSGLIRAYVQPINPDWFSNGKEHIRYIEGRIKKDVTATEIANENKRALRRETDAKLPFDKIPQKYIDITFGVLKGEIPDPSPGAVHYLASWGGKDEALAKAEAMKFLARRSDLSKSILPTGSSYKSGYNWFFSSPGTESFKVSTLEDGNAGQEYLINIGSADAPKTAIVLILAGAAAYKLAEIISKEQDLNAFLKWFRA